MVPYYKPPRNVGIVWNCAVLASLNDGSRSSNVIFGRHFNPFRTCKISDRPDEHWWNYEVVSTLATGRISCNLLSSLVISFVGKGKKTLPTLPFQWNGPMGQGRKCQARSGVLLVYDPCCCLARSLAVSLSFRLRRRLAKSECSRSAYKGQEKVVVFEKPSTSFCSCFWDTPPITILCTLFQPVSYASHGLRDAQGAIKSCSPHTSRPIRSWTDLFGGSPTLEKKNAYPSFAQIYTWYLAGTYPYSA